MGRYYFQKRIEADYLKQLSIFWLKRNGYLKSEYNKYGGIEWNNQFTEKKDSIDIQSNVNTELEYLQGNYNSYIKLIYNQKDLITGEKKDLNYNIELVKTYCNYGGFRYWFKCPRCKKRVGKLYKVITDDYFTCRHCHNLTYRSSNKTKILKKDIFQLERMFNIGRAIIKGKELNNRCFYNGKPTRRYKSFLKFSNKVI